MVLQLPKKMLQLPMLQLPEKIHGSREKGYYDRWEMMWQSLGNEVAADGTWCCSCRKRCCSCREKGFAAAGKTILRLMGNDIAVAGKDIAAAGKDVAAAGKDVAAAEIFF